MLFNTYECFKELPNQDVDVFQKYFKQAKQDNRKYHNLAEQHGYGMGADNMATNEMTKNLTDLANALQ